MSILVLTCAERTLQANLEILNKYGPFTGAAELRADRLLPEELPLLEKFPAMTPLPVILTIRRKADGGAWSGTEEERVRLLRENLSRKIEARKGFAFTDVEEDIFLPVEEAAFRKAGGRIIRSLYSFAGLPENLLQRIGEGRKHPADIPKAAVKITSVRDLSRLFDISLDLRGDFILIGMGETGIPFGILSGRLGCFLNFFSPEEKETAPGHFDPKTLEEVYRFSSINRDTRVFGIIGSPVLHTKSPLIHNAGLKALGMNAVYVPFPLPDTPEDLSGFLALARRIGVEALSVTIPFKEKILPLLAASGAEVRAAGACNTVSIGPGGWEGNNFDIQGFLVPLRRALGRKISGLMCTVLGAGGAARAAVRGLMQEGAEVLALNRTPGKAGRLASDLGCAWAALDAGGLARMKDYSDVIVQTTSAGMHPQEDVNPAAGYTFTGRELAYDLVYSPPDTPFLTAARLEGCRTLGGLDMLLEQAYCQFRVFTGRDYPETAKLEIRGLLREQITGG